MTRTKVPTELRALSEHASQGKWEATTIGTASQWQAAAQAADAVLATRIPDRPDVQFTDMSWLRTEGSDWLNIACVGNGPTSPENAKFAAAAVNWVRELLTEQGL